MLRIPTWVVFLLVIGTGVILLSLSGFRVEGFRAGMPSVMCGVDMAPCGGSQRCINGQCMDQSVPPLPANELRVLPVGAINGRL